MNARVSIFGPLILFLQRLSIMVVGTSGNSCEVCAQIRIFVEIDPRGLVFKYSSMWKLDG